MKKKFLKTFSVSIALILSIILQSQPSFSQAKSQTCSFFDAEYVPSGKSSTGDVYDYKITIQPNPHPEGPADPLRAFFILNIIDHTTGKIETKFRMAYVVPMGLLPVPMLSISLRERADITFLDKDFIEEQGPYSQKNRASYSIILPDAYYKFNKLSLEEIDAQNIEYFSDKKVKPGTSVGDHFELIPDVWILNKCLK